MIALAPFLLLVGYLSEVANGFYLPGVTPKNFEDGEKVELKVNKLRWVLLWRWRGTCNLSAE
jgi:hypothetical protein